AEGIPAPADPGAARGQRGHPPVPAQGNLGLAASARHALFAHLRAKDPPKDRNEPDAAAHAAHRARRRLPSRRPRRCHRRPGLASTIIPQGTPVKTCNNRMNEMSYQAPVADIAFALKHSAGIGALLAEELFGDLAEDTVEAVISEAGKFASDILAPLNTVGDRH